MYEQDLISAGLSEREAKVYLAALELGETTVDRIAKKSGVKRTTVYLEVESLKTKGLLSAINKGKKNYLFAEDPRILERNLEEKKEALQKSLPGILALANFIDKKPKIRYFEGAEGIREAFKDTLNYPDQEVCVWYSDSFALLGEDFFTDYYIPKRIEKKIWTRSIISETENIKKSFVAFNQEQLRKSKLVDSEKFNLDIEIMIYGKSKVALVSFEEKIAVIMESPKVNRSFQQIFDLMWELLPER